MSEGMSVEEYERQREEEANSRQRGKSKAKAQIFQRREAMGEERFRMLPATDIAEKGMVCSMMLQPKEVAGLTVLEGLTAEWFHNPALSLIFGQILEMLSTGKAPDEVTLTQWLHDRNLLEQTGGPAFLSELFTYLPTATNAKQYAESMEEKFLLRELIRICSEIAERSFEEQDNVKGLIEELEVAASELALRKYKKRSGTMKEAVLRVLGKVAAGKTEEAWGLSTGFKSLDAVMRGLRAGNMIAIGGETSAGKTSLALNFVHNISVIRGFPTVIFTLEMSEDEITEVLVQIGSGCNVDAVAEGRVSDKEIAAFNEAAMRLAEAKVSIRDEKEVTISQIRSICRILKPRLIVIDYAQLCKGSKKKYDRADLEIADISRNAKLMAGELDATVLLLTQLNDDGKIAGSRTIAKDADQLLIVEYGETEDERIVAVCKQRRGKKDRVKMRWIGPCQKFLSKALT